MEYPENSVRITLSRMKSTREIIAPQRGIYKLEKFDQTYLSELEKKVSVINVSEFKYTLIITAFDSSNIKSRQRVVNLLRNLGFGALGNGVYVGIGDKRSALTALSNYSGSFKTLLTDALEPCLTPSEVIQCWNLDAVQEQISYLANRFTKIKNGINLNSLDNLELLHQYLRLINLVGEYYAIDPMLPKKLIGANWAGYKLLLSFINYGKDIVKRVNSEADYNQFFDYEILNRI